MPSIYLIGDSTVDSNQGPIRGWGWALPNYFHSDISFFNHAKCGCSTRSFWEEKRFEPVYRDLSVGDALLIQFGHNDEKDDERHTDPGTSYTENLLRYCHMAEEKGATPILLTPVCRRYFSGSNSLLYTHGEYALAVRTLSKKENIPLCDLKSASRELFLRLGPDLTEQLFCCLAPGEHPAYPEGHIDYTHFNETGAFVIAYLVSNLLSAHPYFENILLHHDLRQKTVRENTPSAFHPFF